VALKCRPTLKKSGVPPQSEGGTRGGGGRAKKKNATVYPVQAYEQQPKPGKGLAAERNFSR